MESLNHVKKSRPREPSVVTASVVIYSGRGHMQRFAVSGSKPKTFVVQQSALVFFMEDRNK